MSDTLEKLQLMLAGQLGMNEAEIDPDSLLRDIGMDAAAMEQFRFLIEDNYNTNMYAMVEEEYDIDMPEHHMQDQTLRQLADWIDHWINFDGTHPLFHGRHMKPI